MPLVLFIRVCIDLDIAALEGLVYPSRRRTSFTGLSCTMGNGIMTQLLPRLQTRITEEEWLVYKAIPALALLLRFSVVVSRLRASRKRSVRTSTLWTMVTMGAISFYSATKTEIPTARPMRTIPLNSATKTDIPTARPRPTGTRAKLLSRFLTRIKRGIWSLKALKRDSLPNCPAHRRQCFLIAIRHSSLIQLTGRATELSHMSC